MVIRAATLVGCTSKHRCEPRPARPPWEIKHGSEDTSDPTTPAEPNGPVMPQTILIDAQQPSIVRTPIKMMNHYELSAYLETQGFKHDVLNAVIQRGIDGDTLFQLCQMPQFIDVAASEFKIDSIIDVAKLKAVALFIAPAPAPAPAPTGNTEIASKSDDDQTQSMKGLPTLPSKYSGRIFSATQWRAYGIALSGRVTIAANSLGKRYKSVFANPHLSLDTTRLTREEQTVDIIVFNSMIEEPKQVIIDILADEAKYTLNSVQSGLRMAQTIGCMIHIRTESVADSIRDRLLTLDPVTDPTELRKRMQFIDEQYSKMVLQGDGVDDAIKGMVLRKAIKVLLTYPDLNCDFAIPYTLLKETYKGDIAKQYEFVANKAEEFERTLNPKSTAIRTAAAAQPRENPHLTLHGVCMGHRENEKCPKPPGQCTGDHTRTGKVCTNKWFTKVGVCSNWSKCHDMHPYDENHWGISRKDAILKYREEIRQNP